MNPIPTENKTRKEWEKRKFHNLKPIADAFKTTFDIDMLEGIDQREIDHAVLMFHRRHVYEHNAGAVDQKYITDSGDTSVRINQVIRENRETVTRLINAILLMAKNIHVGLQKKFPPEQSALN